jgi:hypothetical protein
MPKRTPFQPGQTKRPPAPAPPIGPLRNPLNPLTLKKPKAPKPTKSLMGKSIGGNSYL